jgi:hypothetical protein
MDTKMGALPWVAWGRYELARALERRGSTGDREGARRHLATCAEIARSLEMGRLADRAAPLAARLA